MCKNKNKNGSMGLKGETATVLSEKLSWEIHDFQRQFPGSYDYEWPPGLLIFSQAKYLAWQNSEEKSTFF